jgi:glycosyltransferase involved in cell wall biosynthesis
MSSPRKLRIAILGPPTRISGSSKIAFGQAAALLRKGHDVRLFLQGKGLPEVLRAYDGIFPTSRIIEVPSVPLFTLLLDNITRSLRTLRYGADTPLTGNIWYEEIDERRTRDETNGTKTEGYVDFAALLMRSFEISSSLSKWRCDAVISYASLISISALQIWFRQDVTRLGYFLDMPASKTLAIEGKSRALVPVLATLEKFIAGRASAIACNNRLGIKDWSSWIGITPRMILPGCNPLPEIPPRRGDFVLTVTHWYPTKRPFYFLQLAELLRDSSLSIVMAGHWPVPSLLKDLRRKIIERDLGRHLRLVVEPNEDDLKKLYQTARCFVAPPLAGGFVIGALEAAACGTPIMYPKSAGAWDAFEPGQHGFVMNVANPHEVAALILRFEDLGLTRRMGKEIWERAKELSWDRHATVIEEMIS